MLEQVMNETGFDYDKSILRYDYYRRQKIKDEHIEICLQESNMFLINNVLKSFIGTGNLEIKKAR